MTTKLTSSIKRKNEVINDLIDEILSIVKGPVKAKKVESIADSVYNSKKKDIFFENKSMDGKPTIVTVLLDIINKINFLFPAQRKIFLLRFTAFLDLFIDSFVSFGFDDEEIFEDCYPDTTKVPQITYNKTNNYRFCCSYIEIQNEHIDFDNYSYSY